MAVLTRLTKEDVETITKAYGFGRVYTFQGIESGIVNTNYKVVAERGGRREEIILTLFEPGGLDAVPKEQVEEYMKMLQGLANHPSKNLRTPRPYHRVNSSNHTAYFDSTTRNISSLPTARAKPVVVTSFLRGTQADILLSKCQDNERVRLCAALGDALGKLHKAVPDSGSSRPFPKNRIGVWCWKDIAEKIKRYEQQSPKEKKLFDANFVSELSIFVENAERAWEEKLKNLPKGIIHGDLFPDNALVLRNPQGEWDVGIIDLYGAGEDVLAYDLAIALNAWCIRPDKSTGKNRVDTESFKALVKAYHAVRPLSLEEQKNLPLLCEIAATRFALSRADMCVEKTKQGAVNPVIRDPREYLSIARMWNQVQQISPEIFLEKVKVKAAPESGSRPSVPQGGRVVATIENIKTEMRAELARALLKEEVSGAQQEVVGKTSLEKVNPTQKRLVSEFAWCELVEEQKKISSSYGNKIA